MYRKAADVISVIKIISLPVVRWVIADAHPTCLVNHLEWVNAGGQERHMTSISSMQSNPELTGGVLPILCIRLTKIFRAYPSKHASVYHSTATASISL